LELELKDNHVKLAKLRSINNVEGIMNQINASDLYPVLNEVEQYPVSSEELSDTAMRVGARTEVVEFFESLPSINFESESEVLSTAEQVGDETLTIEGEGEATAGPPIEDDGV
jgi:hypothetical protein